MKPKHFVLLIISCSFLMSSCVKKDIDIKKLRLDYANGESQFAMISGMNVHYRDEGHERAPCILMLHDMGSSLHAFEKWADTLKLSYRVLRLDLPGNGLTGPHPQEDYSMKMYRDMLDEFLADMGVRRCYVVGNGLGGRLAWELALAYPKRVRRLVLISPEGYPLGAEYDTPMDNMAKTSSMRFKKLTPKKAVKKSVEQNYSDPEKATKEEVDRHYDLLRRKGNRKAYVLRVKHDDYDRTRRLRDIEIPVLLMWGTDDKVVPIEHASAFHKILPNSKMKFYPNTGHYLQQEIPSKGIIDIMDFLDYRK